MTQVKEEKGFFLVLEGVDGAGTTTQALRVAEKFRAEGRKVHVTREPSTGPIGVLLRQFLTGRLVARVHDASASVVPPPPNWAMMAQLFAADRMDHLTSEIEPLLEQNYVVISDRYDASSLAYQSVTSGFTGEEALSWIKTLNQYARRPDLTLVFQVSYEVAEARRLARGEPAELYEKRETQKKLSAFYMNLKTHLPHDKISYIDAGKNISEVTEDIWQEIEAHRASLSIGTKT